MAADDTFHYTYRGGDGEHIPRRATHVRVAPTVTSIPEKFFHYRPNHIQRVDLPDGLMEIGRAAFFDCSSLQSIGIPHTVETIPEECFQHCGELREVELHEGLREIGMHAFDGCSSLKSVHLPTTLKRIGKNAFFNSVSSLDLPDGLESIGEYAFSQCKFPRLRIPPLLRTIPLGALRSCKNVFTLELPEHIERMEDYAFSSCHSLRNVYLPEETLVIGNAFQHCTDLETLFGSNDLIEAALRQRFEGLPIHRRCYFASYCHPPDAVVVQITQELNDATGPLRAGSGDCLGMTPLHILACSCSHNLELYKVIVDSHPNNLIAHDKWGALPILYAFWNRVPEEIVHYLIESIRSSFPDYELNWDEMIQTLGVANVPPEVIQNVLDAQRRSFPTQTIHWEIVLDKLAQPIRSWKGHYAHVATFRYLVAQSVVGRIQAIGLKAWRAKITDRIALIRDGHRSRRADLASFMSKLSHVEDEYRSLKEATTVLELFLWKSNIADNMDSTHHRNQAEYRRQCRVSCKADNVIENVLPFLLPPKEPEMPANAYFLFAQDAAPRIAKENPGLSDVGLMSMVNVTWKTLSMEEKKPYNDRAAAELEKYRAAMKAYRQYAE